MSRKVKKKFEYYRKTLNDIDKKLKRIEVDPRKNLDAHKLKGELKGRWSCSLGGDIRMIYFVNDIERKIEVVAIGSHKIY